MQRVSHNRKSGRCKYMQSDILIQDRNSFYLELVFFLYAFHSRVDFRTKEKCQKQRHGFHYLLAIVSVYSLTETLFSSFSASQFNLSQRLVLFTELPG